MSFDTLLASEKKSRGPGPGFKIVHIMSTLDTETAEAIQTALEDETSSSEAITAALRGMGQSIGVSSIRRYRRDVLGMRLA